MAELSYQTVMEVRFIPGDGGHWRKTWLDLESIVGLDARNAQRALGLNDRERTEVTLTLTRTIPEEL